MKTIYGAISVHSAKFKINNGSGRLLYINEIEENEMLEFKTRKDVILFIKSHNAWALKPIKILKHVYKVDGKFQYYSIFS